MSLIRWRDRPRTPEAFEPLTTWMERMFEPWSTDQLPELFARGKVPAANVAEDQKNVTVSLEMPGLEEKDIDVQFFGNQLVVHAERKFEDEKKDKDFHRVEQQYGSLRRSLLLPAGLRTDAADAVYEKGILSITIPKVEETPATKIKVKGKH